MSRVAIVSAVRTPIGKAGRAYAGVHPVDLLAAALEAAVGRSGVDPEQVDEVLVGCTHQAGDQSINVARNGWLAAGLPYTTAATTLDFQCGSSQQAVRLGTGLISSGACDVVVAAGVESLSRVPLFSTRDALHGEAYSPAQLARFDMPHQGTAAERVARKYGVDRATSDAYGLRSHRLADEAWQAGAFEPELVRLESDTGPLLAADEGIRADTSEAKLAALLPVYEEGGIITAGTSSQLSDGAAALVLASEAACSRFGLEPLAWVRRTAAVGVDPNLMHEGPIVATQRLLAAEGLTPDDIDLFEIHEAYTAVVCAWRSVFPIEDERLNLRGGAIAMGHPFGASGARQLAGLVHLLHATGRRRGLQAMCCGGGLGSGSILEAA